MARNHLPQESREERKTPSMISVLSMITCTHGPHYSSQAARRDQNRIAQREFRLRKQQRVSGIPLRSSSVSVSPRGGWRPCGVCGQGQDGTL